MTTLGNAPGGPQFIEHLMGAVQTLALLYVNSPDAHASAHLDNYLKTIAPHVVDAVGAGTAEKLFEIFRGSVMGRKHEIESNGPTSRTLQ